MKQVKPVITVVGSCNMDLVVKASKIPIKGETVLGGDFFMIPGGKGANQAVATAKLGAEVYFVGRIGDDTFGEECICNLKKEGVQTQYIVRDRKNPSGVALIMVDKEGHNIIVVAPGANHRLCVEDIKESESVIASSNVLVLQLEIPMVVVKYAVELARKCSVCIILNPAPAQNLSHNLLEKIDILTPNEIEAGILSGIEVTDIDSAKKAARNLLDKGVKAVVLTMAEKGVLLATGNGIRLVPAKKVKAVDTTAAGDAFTGGLAYSLSEGKTLYQAVNFANHVAALSVTKIGAQSSMPTRNELGLFMKK